MGETGGRESRGGCNQRLQQRQNSKSEGLRYLKVYREVTVTGFQVQTYLLALRILFVKWDNDNTCFPRSVPKSHEMMAGQSLMQAPEPIFGDFGILCCVPHTVPVSGDSSE